MEALLYWGVALLALSLILLAVEVFVPSAGVISVVAVALAVVGLIVLFRSDWRWGVSGLLAVLILGPTVLYFGFQMFPSTSIGRKVLSIEDSGDEDRPPPGEMISEFEAYIDAEAEAASDLRPGGFVRIQGKRVPAMSEVSFIRTGQRVRVTGADAMHVRVRPIDGTSAA